MCSLNLPKIQIFFLLEFAEIRIFAMAVVIIKMYILLAHHGQVVGA